MANRELRQGNSYTDTPVVTLTNDDDTPFNLTDTTVTLRATDQLGNLLLTHFITIDNAGGVVANDGLELVGTPAEGAVTNELTSLETSAMSGWVRWTVRLTQANGNVSTVASGGWNVIEDSPYIVPNGVSRLTIRRRVLQKLGDLIVATASATGTNSTFIDQRRLIGEPQAYRGMQALMTSVGLNHGEERYVTGSERETRSITFDYALPTHTEIGDEVELINFRGIGYHFEDVNRAIYTAVEDAAPGAPEPVILTNTAMFTRVPGVISIPDDWVSVGGVQWRDDDQSTWNNMTYSGRLLGAGWSIDRANRTINIGKQMGYRVEDKETQITGFRMPTPPENDEDLIGIDASWVVAQCVALLSSAAYRRNPTPDRQAVMAMDDQQAGILRSRVLRRTGPNVVRL